MMGTQKRIILCADSESLMRPWLMGLDGIDVESFDWLIAFSKADKARAHIAASKANIDEVWVVSSNDIESVNLAAAIRKDDDDLSITLILAELSGSILSRASSAGIKTVYTTHEFAERFALEVDRRRRLDEVDALGYEEIITTIRKKTAQRRKLDIPKVESERGKEELPEKAAFVIGIFSGSGGVGKSVVSAVSSYVCARKGMKTLLVDADFQFGDISSLFGRKDAPCIDDALEDFSAIKMLAQKYSAGIPALIAASKKPEHSDVLDKHFGGLLAECMRHFDVVIVNTGSYWQESHAVLLESSDCSLFLMDQRASSIRANSRVLDLCQRMGVATNGFIYVLNRCEKKSLFSALDIAGVMNGAQVYELKDGGIEVEESCGAGCVEEILDAGSPFVSSLKTLLVEVLPDARRNTGAAASGYIHEDEVAGEERGNAGGKAALMRSSFFRGSKSSRRRGSRKRDRRSERSDEFRVEVSSS